MLQSLDLKHPSEDNYEEYFYCSIMLQSLDLRHPSEDNYEEYVFCSVGLTPKKKVARAHHIADSNREVASLLHSHQDQTVPERDTNREGDAEKLRKLSRMEAIRQKEGIDNKFNTIMVQLNLYVVQFRTTINSLVLSAELNPHPHT